MPNIVNEALLDAIMADVRAEVHKAASKHKPMNSAHEGYAVLLEEVDELWEEVKQDTGYTLNARNEAKQVAAMGVRYIYDLIDGRA